MKKRLRFCGAFVYPFPWPRDWWGAMTDSYPWRERVNTVDGSDNVGQQHPLPVATSLYSATLLSLSAIDSGVDRPVFDQWSAALAALCICWWWVVLAGKRDAWWGGTEEENRPAVALNQHPQLQRYRNDSPFHRRKATFFLNTQCLCVV